MDFYVIGFKIVHWILFMKKKKCNTMNKGLE